MTPSPASATTTAPGSTPPRSSAWVSPMSPSSTGRRRARPSSTTYTCGTPSSSKIAVRGKLGAAALRSTRSSARTNAPGTAPTGYSFARTKNFTVPVSGSTTGARRSTTAAKRVPSCSSSVAGAPACTAPASRSGTCSSTSSTLRSARLNSGVEAVARFPTSIARRVIVPSKGATTIVWLA